MKKHNNLYIYIEDEEHKMFSIVGPVDHDTVNDWLDIGNSAAKSDQNLRIFDLWEEDLMEYIKNAESRGFMKVQSNEIISPPRDRSAEYKKALPKYAQNIDRNRLIKLLCKGKCGKVVWAELNSAYPGKEALKKASMGEYQARCIKCGKVALDNYNWFRD